MRLQTIRRVAGLFKKHPSPHREQHLHWKLGYDEQQHSFATTVSFSHSHASRRREARGMWQNMWQAVRGTHVTSWPWALRPTRSWGANSRGNADEQETALQTYTWGAVR